MKGGKVRGWRSYSAVLFACLSLLALHVHAGTNISIVVSLTELTGKVDVAYTNSTMARVILPGIGTYTNNLDVMAFTDTFETNFLATLPGITNRGTLLRPVEVEEFTNSPRKRYYFSLDGVAVHTTTVGIANYPTNWIQSTYGNCPSWLSGVARDEWFVERDPCRQIVTFFLIATSDVPAWCAALTNVGHSIPSSVTNLTFLQAYSNDIALAWTPGSASPDMLVHAPSDVSTLDLYKSTNLADLAAWRLFATLDHVTDPLLFEHLGTDPAAFFAAGNPDLDTDGDGLSDVKEFFLTGTDPTLRDTIGDGIGDGTRILTYGLSAENADSDGDGLSDAYEIAMGLNPTSADTDGDGLSDYAEVVTYFGYTSPTNADTDRDGLNDYAEVVTHSTYAAPYHAYVSPNDAADTDNDRLSDYAEIHTNSCSPLTFDTDGDGMYDNFEVYYGLNPLNAGDANQDTDADGFNNLTEYRWYTNPTVSNGYPTSYIMITHGAGTNEVRRKAAKLDVHNVFAMGDLGAASSLIRILPRWFGTTFCERRLVHTGTAGFRIDGTPVGSVPSPIVIPATATAVEYRITVDAGYAGSSITFDLQDTNGQSHADVVFYSPKIQSADFHVPGSTSVNVGFGDIGDLWVPMPTDTNACRLRVCPGNITGAETQIRDLHHTEWLRARVFGPGATPSDATLNELDWRSAYVPSSLIPGTRGIQLVPGVHTAYVGVDANANSVLDTNEIHVSCKVYVPRIDLTTDSDNDGTIAANDNTVEDALPGKLIFKDKDLQAVTGSNESDVVAMNVTFDLGGATVPDGCYGVLEWIPESANETVEVFLDAAGTNQLSWTGYHPTYSNQTVRGHLFDAGDTVPSTLYLKASPYALAPIYGEDTITHGTVTLICYRCDTKKEVCRDTVTVSVANRPAVTPKNDKFYIWAEEQTDNNRYTYAGLLWNAVSTNLTTNTVHLVPYRLTDYKATYTNMTPANFTSLAEAGILVTAHHGGEGSVIPVAFSYDSVGQSAADAWAQELGTNWATRVEQSGCWGVSVKSSYLCLNWKSLRDANNAMYWAMCCFPAASNQQESLPSVLSAAGGALNCGGVGITYSHVSSALFCDCLFSMRRGKWRTGIGACYSNGLYAAGYTNTGHGRVTLWPAPLRNSTPATYPKSQNLAGVASLVLDTVLRDDSGALSRLSGDARMAGTPQWIVSGSQRCGLRWPYINDTSTYPTRVRANPDRCLADPWMGDDKKKMLAGDGKTCGQSIEWEF